MHSETALAMREQYANRCEYQLWAQPAGQVFDAIRKMQLALAADNGHTLCQEEKPHVQVAQFLSRQEMEETLTRWIYNICRLQKSFSVTLNNFSAVPPCTLFIRIQNPEPIKQLASQFRMLDGFMEANDCLPVQLPVHPRLMVATALPGELFEKAACEYAAQSFHETFKVEKLLLLRRSSVSEPFKLINTFALPQGLEETVFYNQS